MDSTKGLDLHITDTIVEAIRLPRGRVKVESEEGQGATFIITLPRDAGSSGE